MATLPPLPYIPLEVGEYIIDQLSGDVDSLCSCALTCRGWNRYAACHLIAAIRVRSRDDLYSISDYIASSPRLARFVRSLSMLPHYDIEEKGLFEVLPVDLLKRLPNLQVYSIISRSFFHQDISFHPTTLICMKTYLHVEELQLKGINFATSAEFARVLIALPQLRRLGCAQVGIGSQAIGTVRFRDKCRSLSEVTIAPVDPDWGRNSAISPVDLLVQVSLSTLKVLRYHVSLLVLEGTASPPDLSELKQLDVLEFICITWDIERSSDKIIPILTTLRPNMLRNLTISVSRRQIFRDQVGNHPLEDAILALGTPSVVFTIHGGRHGRLPLWSKMIHSQFRRLHEGHLLQVRTSVSGDPGEDGFDGILAMTASPDGRYVATASFDGYVLLWSGTTPPEKVIQLQYPEDGTPGALQFSDTGEFLAGKYFNSIIIWRVIDSVHVVSISGLRLISYTWHRDTHGHLTITALRGTPEVFGTPLSSITVTATHLQFLCTGEHDTDANPASSPPEVVVLSDRRNSKLFELLDIKHTSSGRVVAAQPKGRPGAFMIWCRSTSGGYAPHELSYASTILQTSVMFAGDEVMIVGSGSGDILWWDISSFPLATTEPSGSISLRHPVDRPNCYIHHLSMSPLCSFLVAACYDDSGSTGEPIVAILRRTDSFRVHGALNAGFDPPHIFLLGHTANVNAACFSPCERYIATASDDCTVNLWRTRDGELLWTFRDHDAEVTHVVFSSDGRVLYAGDRYGEVRTHYVPMFVRGFQLSTVDSP